MKTLPIKRSPPRRRFLLVKIGVIDPVLIGLEINMFCRLPVAALALIAVCTFVSSSFADISAYSQDFEGLDINDTSTAPLGNDGWLVGANVFDAGGGFVYNYFAFPAPNDGGGFTTIAAGQGGALQGAQQLNTFSDYNNGNHFDSSGFVIESNIFREYTVGAADVGETYSFEFDAKLGNIAAPSTALAFIKTLDPNNGFALTNFLTVDAANFSGNWSTHSIDLAIDASLEGQIFQIGFLNTATAGSDSGVFYDSQTILDDPGPIVVFLLFLNRFFASNDDV